MDNCGLLRVLVKAKGVVEMSVSGQSMSPFLLPGDKVSVVPCINLRAGDLVVLPGNRSGEPVLHRVTSISSGEVAVVGDNACAASTVPVSQLIGQVTKMRLEGDEGWCALPHMLLAEDIARLSCHIATGGDDVLQLKLKRRELCAFLRAELMGQGRS